MRRVVASLLLAMSCAVVVTTAPAGQNAKQPDPKKKDQAKFAPPKMVKPDEATLKVIAEKTEQLRKAVEALKAKKTSDDVLIEIEIYLKAAENIVRFEEWYNAASGKWALTSLDQGLERAKLAEGGKAVWRDAPGKWVNRAYRSLVDDSIQPYAVLLPPEYGKDPKKKWRLDVVLHGRDGSLTEAKFLATHNGAAPKDRDFVQLEVYGRGNNAYRWAGETDVFEALHDFKKSPGMPIDEDRIVLRGFSMGGAGTWHIGLHHPGMFCVMGPGAGFTTTHGYAPVAAQLPDYQEKCLHIYDAVDYAENAFNIPIVAYSGEKDAQKKAADNIAELLKEFKEPLRFTHLIAPGLEHQMPAEWQAKAETEYRKYTGPGRDPNPKRIRFVTYTPRYGECAWLEVNALENTYDRTLIDATRDGNTFTITTKNARRLKLVGDPKQGAFKVTADGQNVAIDPARTRNDLIIEKMNGTWVQTDAVSLPLKLSKRPEKTRGLQGPIDDAFRSKFTVVGTKEGWPAAAQNQFATLWDRYFRGKLPTNYHPELAGNLVLFGTPETNPRIAEIVPKLPITWTKEKLVVNGAEYDSKTHFPVLIYPNPAKPSEGYIVINSGHTFKEADLKGTNALLFPRLGDWAVVKPTPTEKDPAAFEVVAAGLFDESWQFPKTK